MSFWNLSDGDTAVTTEKEFDAGGGNMEPMPEGTTVLAMPDEAGWKTNQSNDEYINIRWTVLKPAAYENRKIFQKLWVTDSDPNAKDPQKKRDKALRMLSAIDANAGGRLGKKAGRPSDDDLAMALISKQMVLRLGVWEMGEASGNWVQSVAPKDKPVAEISKADAEKKKSTVKPNLPKDDLDDDVPF